MRLWRSYAVLITSNSKWITPTETTIYDALKHLQAEAKSDSPKKLSRTAEAQEFLKQEALPLLEPPGTQQCAKPLIEKAVADGISEATLSRARKSLGIESKKEGKRHVWYLPAKA